LGLYIPAGTLTKPIIFGGGQESQLRSGTENVPGICGFGAAVDITFRKMEESSKYCEKLKSMLWIC